MSADSIIQSEQEVLSKAVSDLSSLGRVSHKLAMTNAGAPLEKVLSVLLPRLLIRVGANRALQQEYRETKNVVLKDTLTKIHAKLVEMLSHIIQRIKADFNCQIPNKSILELLYNENYTPKPNVDVFTMNLTLTFLNIGVSRCCYQQVEALLPGLLVLLASHSGSSALETAAKTSQSHQIAHLLLKVIERMVTEERVTSASSLMPPLIIDLGGRSNHRSIVKSGKQGEQLHGTSKTLVYRKSRGFVCRL